jgi:hypothetical protein
MASNRSRWWRTALVAVAATVVVPRPAPVEAAPSAQFHGPLLSYAENTNTSWGRDGGFSVPLPNGTDFWVFADTPRYEYKDGWKLTAFIPGTTAAVGKFTPGRPPAEPLTEVHPGGKLSPDNKPTLFMSNPFALRMPDASGRPCTKANGGPKANQVRWVTGAALMPDQTNVLIPYLLVCVIAEQTFQAQGWGFALFNWKTRKFSAKPFDVFPGRHDGGGYPSTQFFGSPIVDKSNVTFYSWTCCAPDSHVFATTMRATASALRSRASYIPKVVASLPATFYVHAAPRSKYHSRFTLYESTDAEGGYKVFSAVAPAGPWTQVASGVLPRCGSKPRPCQSIALHSEVSAKSRLLVSYHLAAYGPGVASKHPYPHDPLRHVVMASVPCSC